MGWTRTKQKIRSRKSSLDGMGEGTIDHLLILIVIMLNII